MCKKTKFYIIENDSVEYKIKVIETDKTTEYKMYRSNNFEWSESARGELVEHWVDNGNGFEGLDVDDKHSDYDKMGRIIILANFINSYDKNLCPKFEIMKKFK